MKLIDFLLKFSIERIVAHSKLLFKLSLKFENQDLDSKINQKFKNRRQKSENRTVLK